MFKKSFVAILATLAMGVAAAAPNVISGTNQNGNIEAVGTDTVLRVSKSGGVTYYRAANGTSYSVQDSDSSRFNKIVASFGTNAVTYNGEVYDLAKAKITCSGGGSFVYWAANGGNITDQLSDGCALHQLAVNAGQAN